MGGSCLGVVAAAIAFSKRKTQAMDAGQPATGAVGEAERDGPAVMNGDHDAALREAIDQWLIDLGREEHELPDRLLEVKRRLNGGLEPASVPAGPVEASPSSAAAR